jgi:3'(2'), 5'-bisphosphate nucleotidase
MNIEITDEEVERDLAFCIETAVEAGHRVLGLRNTGRWEGRTMADIGDQAADGLLQGYIRGRYPDDGILSEETADSAERCAKARAWIVDPLDGTKEFSQVRHDWAVHVALTVGGQCALGAVALPSTDHDVLWGVAIPGKERAGFTGTGEVVSGDSPVPAKPRIVCSRSHTPPWVERFAELIGGELVPCGSAGFKVSRLLVGEADLYVHKVGLKEWDTCAPETVARSLGWHVCKLNGDEHVYNQPDPHNHELVVCRPAMRDLVLETVAKAGAFDD